MGVSDLGSPLSLIGACHAHQLSMALIDYCFAYRSIGISYQCLILSDQAHLVCASWDPSDRILIFSAPYRLSGVHCLWDDGSVRARDRCDLITLDNVLRMDLFRGVVSGL
jgi:hypothetical protein